jgi:Cys-tRNA(Pro)/Cys-tRNA(Cys) deacylase
MDEPRPTPSPAAAHTAIVRLLQHSGVPFTIHTHEVARTVADAEARLPFPKEQFLKTVVFRLKTGGWILVALQGQDQVDYRRLAAALGVKRGDLIRPPPEEIEAALGYQIGGVGPIPLGPDTGVLFDEAALQMATVYCGAGRNDRTLEIGLADLIRAVAGQVAPLARERPGAEPPAPADSGAARS